MRLGGSAQNTWMGEGSFFSLPHFAFYYIKICPGLISSDDSIGYNEQVPSRLNEILCFILK